MSQEAVAAIWARISGDKQKSLDGQVAEVKPWLETQGYIVPEDRIIKVDWASLSLTDCPDMRKLLGWIEKGDISAVGMFDRDRLHSEPAHKLLFLETCENHRVKILAKYGPALYEGDEGKLIEYVLTLGKKKQVLRAQISSKIHLRERAEKKGLPTTCQNPYGYYWDESRTRLIASTSWENRLLIGNLALERATLKGIRRELHKRGIPSPRDREWWSEPTISLILKDTVNYGEYRALRRESIEPKQRRGNTYGKTSSKHLPGIPLPNIVVENPIMTKAQHDWILARLEQNRLNSKRNGKRDYLLKGMIHYEGDNLGYYGRDIRHKSWSYRYSPRGQRDGNPRPYLPGPKLERLAEARARELLTSREVVERELGWRQQAIQESMTNYENELRKLNRQENETINAETELLGLRTDYRDKISPEAFERKLTQIGARKKWIAEERQLVSEALSKLRATASSLVGLEQLQERLEERLESKEFADRRFVLEAVGTRIVVTTEGSVEIEFAIPTEAPKDAIALSIPLSACPLYSVVPPIPLLRFAVVGKSTASL